MKVLVAGSTGAVGTPLVRTLVERGHEVYGLTRSQAKTEGLRRLGVTPIVADVMDSGALETALAGIHADAVVHQLTSLAKVPMRYKDMEATNALRTTGTAHLLEAANRIGARRFVTQSFIAGYGYYDHAEDVLTEDSPFGVAKGDKFDATVAAMRSNEEQVCRTDGLEGIALRYGLFYGPGAGTEDLVDMLKRRRMVIPRGGGSTVSWVYIDDAASAVIAALERGRAGEAYNIADDEPVSWQQFLNTAAEVFGTPRPIAVPSVILRPMPYASALMTSSFCLSNAKAKRDLEWAPGVRTIRDGLLRTADVRLRTAETPSSP